MKGYIFITASGTDPMAGNHLKDPTLDKVATFGACQPQIRKQLEREDYLFVVSGSMRSHGLNQYIVGGLQVDEKVHAKEAYYRLPGQRLHHRRGSTSSAKARAIHRECDVRFMRGPSGCLQIR